MSNSTKVILKVISILMFVGLIAGLKGLTSERWVLFVRMIPPFLIILIYVLKRKYYIWTIILDMILIGLYFGLSFLLSVTESYQYSFILLGPLVLYGLGLYVQHSLGYPIFDETAL